MSTLTVLHFPDPRLRKKARPVAAVDAQVRQLSRDMLETMYAENGIGLAATQVNVQQRVVVMDLSEEKNEPATLVKPGDHAKNRHGGNGGRLPFGARVYRPGAAGGKKSPTVTSTWTVRKSNQKPAVCARSASSMKSIILTENCLSITCPR